MFWHHEATGSTPTYFSSGLGLKRSSPKYYEANVVAIQLESSDLINKVDVKIMERDDDIILHAIIC